MTIVIRDCTRPTAKYVRRTRAPPDAQDSPFLLDAASVKLLYKLSSDTYTGMYLHTPTNVRIVKSKNAALQIGSYMSNLRHPHLEQFIGVATNSSMQHHLIVTARRVGQSIAYYLSKSNTSAVSRMTTWDALRVGAQVCQALYYLHEMTGVGHPSLCPHSISYDFYQRKSVVQLTVECQKCSVHGKKPSVTNDVISVCHIMLMLLRQSTNSDSEKQKNQKVAAVISALQTNILLTKTSSAPSMKELCALFSK